MNNLKKDIIRGLVQITIVVIIRIIPLCWPTDVGEFLTGFIGVMLIDIYTTLIEKRKL